MAKKNDKASAVSSESLDDISNLVSDEIEKQAQHSDSDVQEPETEPLDVPEQSEEPLDDLEAAVQQKEADWDQEKKPETSNPVSSGHVVASAVLHNGKMYHIGDEPHGIDEPHLSNLIASGAVRKDLA
jgi:rhodanese-related sulfurtransferase